MHRIRDDAALGDLERQPVRIETHERSTLATLSGNWRLLEVPRRDIDRDSDLHSLSMPRPALATGHPQDVFGERVDEPAPLGELHELARRQETMLRVSPTDERLEAVDGTRGDMDDGW